MSIGADLVSWGVPFRHYPNAGPASFTSSSHPEGLSGQGQHGQKMVIQELGPLFTNL